MIRRQKVWGARTLAQFSLTFLSVFEALGIVHQVHECGSESWCVSFEVCFLALELLLAQLLELVYDVVVSSRKIWDCVVQRIHEVGSLDRGLAEPTRLV